MASWRGVIFAVVAIAAVGAGQALPTQSAAQTRSQSAQAQPPAPQSAANDFDRVNSQLDQFAAMMSRGLRAGKHADIIAGVEAMIAPNSSLDAINRVGAAIGFLRAYTPMWSTFTAEHQSQVNGIALWLASQRFPVDQFRLELLAVNELTQYAIALDDYRFATALAERPPSPTEQMLPQIGVLRHALGSYLYALSGQSGLAKLRLRQINSLLTEESLRNLAASLRARSGAGMDEAAIAQSLEAVRAQLEGPEFLRLLASLELNLARLIKDDELTVTAWRRLEAAYDRQPAGHVADFITLSVATNMLARANRPDEAEAAAAEFRRLINGGALGRFSLGQLLNFSMCTEFYNRDWSRLEITDEARALFTTCETFLQVEEFSNVFFWRLNRATFLERLGQIAAAKAMFETELTDAEEVRDALPLEQRLFFQEAYWREGYAGVARTSAKIASNTGDRADLISALYAAEQGRARQFAERRSGVAPVQRVDIERFAQSLGDGDVVLTLHTLPDDLVVIAFDKKWHSIAVLPIAEHALKARIKTIHTALSDAASDVETLNSDLLRFSQETFGPVMGLIREAKRVIIVSDGPVASFPVALTSVEGGQYRPLGLQAEIIHAPSLRLVLSASQAEPAAAHFFGVGNPTFPAVTLPAQLPREEVLSLTPQTPAVSRNAGVLELAPLPETFDEVIAAKRALGGVGTTLFGSEASESGVKAAPLANARILHFATHGLLPGDVPSLLEPALALTPGQGEDGWLTAGEIEKLRLNAELTVLSACNTGAGRSIAGEGVMGLSRAFLIAGSRSVLASLWPVNSQSTVSFMDVFYARLADGRSAPQALRDAMIEIRRDRPHPKHWAAFFVVSAQL
jgi:CHAT domain-containing protein